MDRREYKARLIAASLDGAFPSLGEDGHDVTCLYRGPGGRKCAVGILLPDGLELSPKENAAPLGQLLDDRPDLHQYLPTDLTLGELGEVQLAHDRLAFAARRNGSWDHKEFARRLDDLPFFRDPEAPTEPATP